MTLLSREFVFCLFINYARIRKWMHLHRGQFPKQKSHGLQWENKTYQLTSEQFTEVAQKCQMPV